ncbi:hypothetical protein DJ019_16770 [Phenylobacterium kunshanense]|uniref:Uncharacterized protein n=1 Tax=Phenylobacterium kunshanense TaxID=1445034 RepID=A0A328BBY3_9CAUL|nr:hypothetical protein DJ019_16770 [Phenylobacterium kunshanense]
MGSGGGAGAASGAGAAGAAAGGAASVAAGGAGWAAGAGSCAWAAVATPAARIRLERTRRMKFSPDFGRASNLNTAP